MLIARFWLSSRNKEIQVWILDVGLTSESAMTVALGSASRNPISKARRLEIIIEPFVFLHG